ncbi:MAG: beta-N-acetylhexosaminidase [Clostridia bacterium]|nr:beta-N-acetylhexosaminidase [Clostridia bacterium]
MKNFNSFGVLIDCSRNAVPNTMALKRFIDIIAKMGYNCAMLYTEDTYEVKGQPFFGYKRGKYTIEELRDIDDYAASMGVEMIPCIQTLAHLSTAFRWEPYREIRDCNDILLAGDDRTYELIDAMFSSLSGAFRSRRIHICMDEAYMVGLGKYLDNNGYHGRSEILLAHLNRVCEIARKYDYEPMMWNDMFFRFDSAGNYYIPDDMGDSYHVSGETCNKIPHDLSGVYWDYYNTDPEVYDRMMKLSNELSPGRVWFAGGAWSWGGITPHNRYSICRNAEAIPACIRNGVENVIITMWGDDGAETPAFAVLPALMSAAAVAEGLTEEEMKAKFREITGVDYDDMLTLDLPNYVYGPEQDVDTFNFSKNRLYNDPFLGIEDKNTTQPVDPAIFAQYAELLYGNAEKYPELGYLFKVQATLCDILTEKFDLGIRTRTLYEKGDREGLRALAEGEYSVFEVKWEAFYGAFRYQWERVNKPYGFEMQDLRLGGLLTRVKNCKRRLLDYADGKTENIPELEEPVLDHDCGEVCQWHHAFSAGSVAMDYVWM